MASEKTRLWKPTCSVAGDVTNFPEKFEIITKT